MKTNNTSFKLRWINCSQIAFHPAPQGIIQFIGGYGFGTFPSLFYRELLRQLFNKKYTIVVLPYFPRCNHIPYVENLFKIHKNIRAELPQKAEKLGLGSSIYDEPRNYFWIGHSLGCEYIALLKLVSSQKQEKIIQQIEQFNILKIREHIYTINNICQHSVLIHSSALHISEQSTLFIAPCFKAPSIISVKPTQQQIWNLIKNSSNQLNLTALISFAQDNTAGHRSDCNKCNQADAQEEENECSDVCFIIKYLKLESLGLCCELPGNHYTPLYIEPDNNTLVNTVANFLVKMHRKIQ